MAHKTDPSEVSKKSPRRRQAASAIAESGLIDPRIDPIEEQRRINREISERQVRRELPEAIIRPAQCPRCKSTRRLPFRDGPLNTTAAPVRIGGELYNRQAWYSTTCSDCGQRYRVIRYGYEPDPVAPPMPAATSAGEEEFSPADSDCAG